MSHPYVHTGNVFFLGNSSSEAADNIVTNGGSAKKPFSTLAYALSKVTAGNGDVILLMPGHAETMPEDADVGLSLSSDMSGVKLIGMGVGASRPTFTFSHASAAYFWFNGSDNIVVDNIRFHANAADVAVAFYVDGTDITFRNCVFTEDTNLNFAVLFSVSYAGDNTADGFIFENCMAYLPDSNNTRCLRLTGSTDGCIIRNNILMGDWSLCAVQRGGGTGSAGVNHCTPLFILDNVVYDHSTAGNNYLISNASTGIAARNLGSTRSGSAVGGVKADAMGKCQNFGSRSTLDANGILDPVAT